MNINEKDQLVLDWIAHKSVTVDIEQGKLYNKDGKELGSFNDHCCTIYIHVDKKTYGVSRGRVIWLYKHKSIPDGFQIGHKSTDLRNDAIDNLELSTTRSRSIKACKTYKRKSGKVSNAKLTLEIVNEARKQLNTGTTSQYKLAKKYGVAKTTLYFAVIGKTWADATEPVYKRSNVPPKQMALPFVEATPKIEAPSKTQEANKIICHMLKNNPKLTNAAIWKFLKMRKFTLSPPQVNTLIKKYKDILNDQ